MRCDICGKRGARIRRVARTYGKGKYMLVIVTGIPFVSGAIIKKSEHKMFREIGDQIKLREIVSETTAKIVWKFLGKDSPIPILWNALHFHPHKRSIIKSNRKPNASGVKEEKKYLKVVCSLFKPKKFCSLGRVGEAMPKEYSQEKKIFYIRHPVQGG